MNKQLINLLSSSQDTVLKNQKEREEAYYLELKKFINRSKSNSSKLNLEIFKSIMNKYTEAMKKCDGKYHDCSNKEQVFYNIKYSNIADPYHIEDGGGFINYREYKEYERLKTFYELSDKRDVELARVYNGGHEGSKIVFLIREINDTKYSVPALLNISEYKKLGIDVSPYFEFRFALNDIDIILENIINTDEKDSEIINNNIIELVKSMKTDFSQREEIRNNCYKRSEKNAERLSLVICKYFIKEYQKNPKANYSLELPCLSNEDEILKTLGKKEYKKYDEYERCNYNNRNLYYIGYKKDSDLDKYTYLPVDRGTFAFMMKPLDFGYYISEKDNKVTIETNYDELENLIINVDELKKVL